VGARDGTERDRVGGQLDVDQASDRPRTGLSRWPQGGPVLRLTPPGWCLRIRRSVSAKARRIGGMSIVFCRQKHVGTKRFWSCAGAAAVIVCRVRVVEKPLSVVGLLPPLRGQTRACRETTGPIYRRVRLVRESRSVASVPSHRRAAHRSRQRPATLLVAAPGTPAPARELRRSASTAGSSSTSVVSAPFCRFLYASCRQVSPVSAGACTRLSRCLGFCCR
jgi:hypothetical protein